MVRRSILTVALVIAFSAAAASTQAFADDDTLAPDSAAFALAQAMAGTAAAPTP